MPEEMTCPQCQSVMSPHYLGEVTVQRCTSCEGVFLSHADLGHLIEGENDYHRDTGPMTQPMPRITADMPVPQPARPTSRAYIETLFH
jgi:Zn-finger nucleic acid-binding protein